MCGGSGRTSFFYRCRVCEFKAVTDGCKKELRFRLIVSEGSGLRVNPFLEQHQRAKVHADESRNGTSSHRSEGSAVASSRPTRSAVERPLTIYDRPYPHADIVYRLVDLLLEKYSTNIEIEVKLGTIFDKSSGNRLCDVLPVCTDSAVSPQYHGDCRFESTVSKQTFELINHKLNNWVSSSQQSDRRVRYEKKRENDIYFDDGTRESRKVVSGEKRRTVERVIRKKRLGDLNMVCPMSPYDLRYSISSEDPAARSASSRPRSEREKDRLSYSFSHLSVDITAVRTHEPVEQRGEEILHLGLPQESYEVEIEIVFPNDFSLTEECDRLRKAPPTGAGRVLTSKLHTLLQELVDSARGIAADIHA